MDRITLRLNPGEVERLRAMADDRGVSPGELLAQWVSDFFSAPGCITPAPERENPEGTNER
jgi:hypothetical protein